MTSTVESSDNQDQFINAIVNEFGMVWDWYSGRHMNGRECPSIVSNGNQTPDDIHEALAGICYEVDSMGLDYVFYAKD